jgi:hypothetical protein
MNIIHLSDLHFGTSQQANLWSSQLLQDLKFELNISTIDALIISGDIASNSTESEYDAALEFINEFRKDFNLEHSQIVIVPGNHDLNWDLSKKAYKPIKMNDYEGPFIIINGEKRPNPSHAIERENDIIEQKDEDLSRDRFHYFSQFFQKIKHKSYPISDYARNYTIDFFPGNADQPLLVLGLNSAWEIDHHYKDRASINMDALSNALKEINRNPDYSRCHKFVVWHHPLDSASNDRIKDRSFLDQLVVSGFCIFMHGHVHKAEMSPYHYDIRTNGRRIHRICAGTFGASTRDLVPGYPWQYNVLQIIRDQVTVTTRRREEENGVWKPDARWSQGAGEDPSPRYTVPLVQTEAVKGETKIRASRRGLAIVDDLSIQRQWDKGQTKYDFFLSNGIRYADCEKFWTRQRIDFKVFKDICTLARVDWREIVLDDAEEETEQIPYFSQFDAAWVGRNDLLSELLKKLNGSCRLLILEGITGIGKTALAECLADRLHVDFLNNNWQFFLLDRFDVDTKSTDFASAATRWLEEWGETIPENGRQNEILTRRVLKKLKVNPYLIILDSFEFLLEGNEDEGWGQFKDSEWVTFFENFLDGDCKSKIILTTQESPRQLNHKYKDTLWYSLVLKGLSESEQVDLFQSLGLEVHSSETNRDYLLRIGSVYEGHPLALKIIAGEIREPRYRGNLSVYWEEHGEEIEKIEKALKEANEKGLVESKFDTWRLENFSKALRERVKKRIDLTFTRLKNESYNAYYLLCTSSLYRVAVNKAWWLEHLDDLDCDHGEKESAFDVLEDHFLVEWQDGSALVRLHNLIRSLALKHLRELEEEEND